MATKKTKIIISIKTYSLGLLFSFQVFGLERYIISEDKYIKENKVTKTMQSFIKPSSIF
jgi:hypothetical protein